MLGPKNVHLSFFYNNKQSEIFMKIEEGQRENFIKFADFTWMTKI